MRISDVQLFSLVVVVAPGIRHGEVARVVDVRPCSSYQLRLNFSSKGRRQRNDIPYEAWEVVPLVDTCN